jgi:hypothetical protein
MKALFFLLSVCAFSFTSAQNKDLLDINQHLKKLNEKNKGKLEKQILLYPLLEKIRTPFSIKIDSSYYLPNGDKVVTLPGYNMPCVVPDMKQFQTMPIAGRNLNINNYSFMPNPAPKMNIEELIAKGIIKNIK